MRQNPSYASRAFTLAEVLIALGLMGLMMGLTVVNMRRDGGTTTAAFAGQVAEELRASRLRAMAGQGRVAVVFPSNDGTTALCRSLTTWEGVVNPHQSRVLNFANEAPDSMIYCGGWAPQSGSETIDRPAPGSGDSDLNVTDWFSPQPVPKDFVFLFTARGTVLTNDLPLINGAYHLVVCAGAQASPSGVPPGTATVSPSPGYFHLEGVCKPTTLSIYPSGTIQVESGLPNASSAVADLPANRGLAGAPPATLAPRTNNNPIVEKVILNPPPALDLPPGVEDSVGPNGHVTLTVQASDVDGDTLYCRWDADGGSFTSVGDTQMTWNPTTQRWRSVWVFRPNPLDARPHIYKLHCHVTDEHGNPGVAASGVELSPDLALAQEEHVVYAHFPYDDIYLANTDGSDSRTISILEPLGFPADWTRVSPDGTNIVFTLKNPTDHNLWAVHTDGGGRRQLTNSPAADNGGSWSPDGSKMAFLSGRGGMMELYVMPAGGEVTPPVGGSPLLPPRRLTTGMKLAYSQAPSWSAGGDKLAIVAENPAGSGQTAVYVLRVNPITCAPLGGHWVTGTCPAGPSNGFQVHYCPDPANPHLLLILMQDSGTTSHYEIWNDDGSGQTILPNPGGGAWLGNCAWTREGRRVVFQDGSGLKIADFAAATRSLGNVRSISGDSNAVTLDL